MQHAMLKNYSADNIAPIVPVRKESCRHPCRENARLFLNRLPTNPVGKRPAFSLSICPHDNPIRGRPLTLLDPHPISNHPCREKARLFFNRFPHSNFGRGRPSTLQGPHQVTHTTIPAEAGHRPYEYLIRLYTTYTGKGRPSTLREARKMVYQLFI